MDPSIITTEQAKLFLDAEAHISYHLLGYLTTMSLKCAIELGIPDVIHKHGKPMTINELANAIEIHPAKLSSLYRLMRCLNRSKFFSIIEMPNGEEAFHLTINSQLLLKDHPISLASLVLFSSSSIAVESGHHWGKWFKSDQDTPFHIAHGKGFWELASVVPELNKLFNDAMASDSRLIATLLLANNDCKVIFEGIDSLVDVGGGNGAMAKAIASSYPELKCIVFDLPHVVDKCVQENNGGNLAYVGGDMFEAIPHANVVLLKWILHDWGDEECIKILKRSKEAIPIKDKGGKVIVIEEVVENSTNQLDAQILNDMEMMSLNGLGRERTEEQWKKLFFSAGFNDYKIFSILGLRSIIEVYP